MLALLLAMVLQLQLPSPAGYVNDFARVLDPASVQAMQRVIDEVRSKSRGEIVVVTMTDLGGRAAIEVARDIGRQWKVGAQGALGDSARNTGIVLLLKPGRRPGDGQAELAITTGSGAEGFVTDAEAGRIRDAIGQASVEQGSYGAGLVAGVSLLGAAYAREFGFQLTGAPVPTRSRGIVRPGSRAPWGLLPLLLFVIVLAATSRRRRGGIAEALLWGAILGGGRRGGGGGGGWGGGGFGGGFGGFGGGGGFSGGGASGRF
jgi:uncharacterized protein